MKLLKALNNIRKPNEKRLLSQASGLCHRYQNCIHQRKKFVSFDTAETTSKIMHDILTSVNAMPSGDAKVAEIKSLINIAKKTIKNDIK